MAIIVTDSTADIPEVLRKSLDIHVVPLSVIFGSESFADGVEITNNEFYNRLVAADALPTTSQPSPEAFMEKYRALGASGEPIISLHIASELSGTIRSAHLAKDELPELDISIIDSHSTSMSLGWAVILAARAAKSGASVADIVELAEKTVANTRLLAILDTLKYLEKGGRIGRTKALLGTLLNVKPIIDVRDGEIQPFEQVRTKKKAIRRLIEELEVLGPFEELCVLHCRAESEAKELVQKLGHVHSTSSIVIAEIGAVVGTHIGPGALGFSGVRRR